ncbi:hypothetical protein [Rhizobacter sp. LjRoot28]|uniref:hypothetical protein n=1 Tax=Rhizobacter sp. LjRoot28 TaxID=3342309 RepID=UPI003ECD0808
MELPAADDQEAIFRFAMSFNAYEVYGSFEAAAGFARAAKRSTLEETRAELFFKARAARHSGSDAHVAAYRELLPLLQSYANRLG